MLSIAASTWALHRTIGTSHPDSPHQGAQPPVKHSGSTYTLLDIPQLLSDHQFRRMELCHFHVDQHRTAIDHLNNAILDAGITLQTLLIDDGDITHPDFADRDTAWIEKWIKIAANLGAERVRVIAGKQPATPETIDRSIQNLKKLCDCSTENGLRLSIENWFSLTDSPEVVLQILDALKDSLGLCADFGNWPTPYKFEALPKILLKAETIHAKCEFLKDLEIDMTDYTHCLKLARDANFNGTFVLVNGGPDNEWDALNTSRSAIEQYWRSQ